MTEQAMNTMIVMGKSSDEFEKWLVSNPEDLYAKLTTLFGTLDLRDLAETAIASAGCGRKPEVFYRRMHTYIERRYPRHPKPPWAV